MPRVNKRHWHLPNYTQATFRTRLIFEDERGKVVSKKSLVMNELSQKVSVHCMNTPTRYTIAKRFGKTDLNFLYHSRYSFISANLKLCTRCTTVLLESSCKCFSVNFSTNFLVENLMGKLMEFCSCALEKSTKKLEIDRALNIMPVNVLWNTHCANSEFKFWASSDIACPLYKTASTVVICMCIVLQIHYTV
jgi:hypothetical protein